MLGVLGWGNGGRRGGKARRASGVSLLQVRHADLTGPRRALKTAWERGACALAIVVLAPMLLALMALFLL